jgi:exosortase/archaeosortase family protein
MSPRVQVFRPSGCNMSDVRDSVPSSVIVGSLQVPPSFFWTLLLALMAVLADQFVFPALFSTAPLFALLACLLLTMRRQLSELDASSLAESRLTGGRAVWFAAAHAILIGSLCLMGSPALRASGTLTVGGWAFLFVKLLVLAPIPILLPWRAWRLLAHVYAAELVAAAVVLVTFFPRRAVEALWPTYGQFLGRFVYLLSWPFVSNLGYLKALFPTLTGPSLDVTILLSCSGINGIELFDVLFALVVICEWPRLNKRHTIVAYAIGIAAMILGNILRITSFVVLGNHGLADFITRFHVNAGWIFFSAVFLLFLSSTFRWMLRPALSSKPA